MIRGDLIAPVHHRLRRPGTSTSRDEVRVRSGFANEQQLDSPIRGRSHRGVVNQDRSTAVRRAESKSTDVVPVLEVIDYLSKYQPLNES
jgi:hypothetical protein